MAARTIRQLVHVPAVATQQQRRDLRVAAEQLHDLCHFGVGALQALLRREHAKGRLDRHYRRCLEGVRSAALGVVAVRFAIVLLFVLHL